MMLKRFTGIMVISSLLFSTAVSSPLKLNAEENNTEETPDEIIEEPVEEVTEEISEVTTDEEDGLETVLPEENQISEESQAEAAAPVLDYEEVTDSDERTDVLSSEYSVGTSAGFSYEQDPAACKVFGFCRYNGKEYWYENGVRQAVPGDPKNLIDEKYHTERGREIFDPQTKAWYWLDSVYDGAKAAGKEVWMPYMYQDEAGWTETEKRNLSEISDEGMKEFVFNAMMNHDGKWVRYDGEGKMLKGWVTIEGALASVYPLQTGNTYYYDNQTGAMAKGYVTLNGSRYHFDEMTGELLGEERLTPDVQPEPEPEPQYTPEPENTPEPEYTPAPQPSGTDFVLNVRTGVYHRPTCSSVRKMKEGNKRYISDTTSEQMRAQGYDPCNICNP